MPLRVFIERPFLRDEVHPVPHRVHEQQVEVLVERDRLLEVVAQAQVDRHPVGRPVAVVHDRDERLDLLQVLDVLRARPGGTAAGAR